MTGDPTIFHLDRLDLSFVPKEWAYAREKRAEMDAAFAELKRLKPAVWNGRVLLMHRQALSDGVMRGEYLETDYASFSTWCRWGRPPAGVHDCFGAAAIVTADKALLLGVMGPHTANAGRIYLPCGTPDPADIVDGKVDLEASVARELKEETGCELAEFDVAPGWTTVVHGPLIIQVKMLHSRETAGALRGRILAHLAKEAQPELADIRIVRGMADVEPAMPAFVVTFLEDFFKPA